MNFKKISVRVSIAALLIATGLISCDNETDTTLNESGRQIVQKANTFQQIQAFAANNGDSVIQDQNIDPSKAISFNTVAEYENWVNDHNKYLEGVINEDVIAYVTKTYGDCADGLYTGSIGAGFATLYFDVVVAGGNITVSSRLGGYQLGISWTQGAYSSKGNVITCVGAFNYNLFVEGIGTVYSDVRSFTITLPC